jgi:hypothetical protein
MGKQMSCVNALENAVIIKDICQYIPITSLESIFNLCEGC